MARPPKYNAKLVAEMVKLVEEKGLKDYRGMKLQDFAQFFGIDPSTFYLWLKTKEGFSDKIEAAKEVYKHNRTRKLILTLEDAAEGGYREESTETTKYRPNPRNPAEPTIAEMTKVKTKKYVKPDVAAAIFLLTNLDPEHFQNRRNSDVVVRETQPRELSLDEAREYIQKLEEEN